MLQHFGDPELSVAEIARHVMLSPNYFSGWFRRNVGCPPYRYLTQIRLHEAQTLLRKTRLPIVAIAEAVGFASPYHFSRVFKQTLGVTPTQFRDARRAGS